MNGVLEYAKLKVNGRKVDIFSLRSGTGEVLLKRAQYNFRSASGYADTIGTILFAVRNIKSAFSMKDLARLNITRIILRIRQKPIYTWFDANVVSRRSDNLFGYLELYRELEYMPCVVEIVFQKDSYLDRVSKKELDTLMGTKTESFLSVYYKESGNEC